MAPQIVGDRLFFVSNMSGKFSLYAMDRGGSVAAGWTEDFCGDKFRRGRCGKIIRARNNFLRWLRAAALGTPECRAALFAGIRATCSSAQVQELDAHINDAEFAEAGARALIEMMSQSVN